MQQHFEVYNTHIHRSYLSTEYFNLFMKIISFLLICQIIHEKPYSAILFNRITAPLTWLVGQPFPFFNISAECLVEAQMCMPVLEISFSLRI